MTTNIPVLQTKDPKVSYRTGSTLPAEYRLAERPNGTLVLQGKYHWHEYSGDGKVVLSGHDWKTLETVKL